MCPPFAAAVHASLPQELRDQIYDALWDEETRKRLDDLIGRSYHSLHESGELNNWILPGPFFTEPTYIGEHFAKEALTYFFRMVSQAEVHYRAINHFLEIDQFGRMEFRPIDILRVLTINVEWTFRDLAYDDLRENMESLLTLPVREDFEIVIYIDRNLQFSRHLFHILELIRPVYHALVAEGVKIKVLGYRFFTVRWREQAIATDNDSDGPKLQYETAEQLNYYFNGTAEEWLQMKDAEIRKIKRTPRRLKNLEVSSVYPS
ncbi:hypothetical protein EK21DRAFT_57280 [Setomelanomma holmii]|uniref:Uncharacterized protein n=1 Tax=Setomelanomma holmii TaxID=210430 RepID=A0A9P4LSS4_9PLEO|nr:hypothetical protein EK21DRAFT_57280 [Setomelanomma holmii]